MANGGLRTAIICGIAAIGWNANAELNEWPETKAMLSAPDQQVVVYKFVNRAIDENRLSEAANALERLVRFRPDLVQARFDLIKLYVALGASELVEEQRDALIEAGAIDDVAGDIVVSGVIAVGVGYDTNPAATPRRDELDFFLEDINRVEEIDLGFEREESALAFLQANIRIAAPIDARTTMTIDLSSYGVSIFEDSDQNEAVIAARVGPEMSFAKGVFRPYLDVGYRHFGNDPYAVAGGLGVEAVAKLGPGTIGFELAGAYRDFLPTRDAPGRENLDGIEARVAVSYGLALTDSLYFDFSSRAIAVNAASDFEDYYGFGADALLSFNVNAFGQPLIASLGGGAIHSRYQTPDFQLLNIPRRDTSLSAYVGLSMDLNEATAIDGSIGYRRRFSNYDIYDSDGFRFTLRLARRF